MNWTHNGSRKNKANWRWARRTSGALSLNDTDVGRGRPSYEENASRRHYERVTVPNEPNLSSGLRTSDGRYARISVQNKANSAGAPGMVSSVWINVYG
jgi:hypothetical protein